MTEMTGGQAIVRSLKQYGVDTVFGLPGVQLDNTFDALYEERDSIRVLQSRHEQTTAYMALGYAQSTGKVGVCLVVPGPGLLNAAAALSTAYSTNTPVLALSGQIQSDMIEKGTGQLHEIPNQLGMVRSVTKWAARADHPSDAPGLVREAFRQLRTGRIRPVELEMAPDIMGTKADVDLLDPVFEYEQPEGDPDKLEEAARVLGKAKKPIIFVGSGVLGAEEELRELAESLQAPVVMSSGGKGALSFRHYLAQNNIAGYDLWMEADAALAVGTRFSAPPVRWGVDEGIKTIHIDIDPTEIGRNVEPSIGIVADAKRSLNELIKRTEKHNSPRESREEELNALKEKSMDLLYEVQPQASYAEVIREELPDDGIFVTEMTQVGYYAREGYPVYEPRTFVHCGYQGTLGYGFATALGVQVANPDKKVISINGDGGFMYAAQELATAVQHKINLVTIVFNDNAFGNVKRIQQQSYGGRTIASDLLNPDFVKFAESFGAAGIRAESPEALRSAIRQGYDNDVPTLIEVPIGEVPGMRNILFGQQRRRGE